MLDVFLPVIGFLVLVLDSLHDLLSGWGLSDVSFLHHIGLSTDLSWGFTIILFTIAMRVLTSPFNMQQIRSSRAMQTIQPQLSELKKKYGKDRERMMQEQMRLYRENKINPMMGCLPMLIQMPLWIALYSALQHLANASNSAHFTGGFLWLPSLAQSEAFPQVLAVLTGLTQWIVQRMMMPQTTDPTQKSMNNAMQFMPLMFVFFALSVPSGLVIYWITSNLFSIGQQYLMMGWGSLFPLPWQKRPATAATAVARSSGVTTNGKQPEADEGTKSILRPLGENGIDDAYRGPGGGKKKRIKRRQ